MRGVTLFPNLSDDQITGMIDRLSPNQKEVFDKGLLSCKDSRQALFIAKSYPEDLSSKKQEGGPEENESKT